MNLYPLKFKWNQIGRLSKLKHYGRRKDAYSLAPGHRSPREDRALGCLFPCPGRSVVEAFSFVLQQACRRRGLRAAIVFQCDDLQFFDLTCQWAEMIIDNSQI